MSRGVDFGVTERGANCRAIDETEIRSMDELNSGEYGETCYSPPTLGEVCADPFRHNAYYIRHNIDEQIVCLVY